MTDFLLEVGTEELPAGFLSDAIAEWKSFIPASLVENNLSCDTVNIYGTPRRLAVLITGLPLQQEDCQEEVKGPNVKVAFKDGQPTKAAEGFAKKQGVELDDLVIRTTGKGEFVFVDKVIIGRMVADVLVELVPRWIFNLEGERFMRWGDGDLRFSRPIRWLLALVDDQVLPMALVNGSKIVNSDRISHGHRVLHPKSITIIKASDYVEALRHAHVIVDIEERKALITKQIQTAVAKINGHTEIYADLLAEVTNLVEYPSTVIGNFEKDFLQLPVDVITKIMVSHQRYFPVFRGYNDLELLPNFITISNGDPNKSDIIATGNERIIRARLADGRFFYETDLRNSLDSFLPKLANVTFQKDLGSVLDKSRRISKIAALISKHLHLGKDDSYNICRAALLCKADLVSQMVNEFPELQGIMGEKYALASREPELVAKAIFEHYLPRSADDVLPQTLTGQVVGLADRLDNLVSIFSLGIIPTGSSDPFALRRAANAVINISWAGNLAVNLHQLLLQISTDFVEVHDIDKYKLIKSLEDFFLQRIRTLLQDEKQIDYDLVNTILGENNPEYTARALQDLLDIRYRAIFLQEMRQKGTLDQIYEIINRSVKLAAQGELEVNHLDPEDVIDTELFQKPSEVAFYEDILRMRPQVQAVLESHNYQQLVIALTKIAPTVNNFLDGPESVLVLDPDPVIKQNRLNLLGILRNYSLLIGDFRMIVKNF
ncbi:glycine--tRNA ligase subunit beta [Richelia intracellularis]|uniref:glycine--tRNA ligase subunit beta n=1 Tax=Richelia intracellularis TaxID=1164990 RepID=UPI0003456B68|nr:glycine--tRNA ligase subunit beta [Richelia intracellularis]HAE05301.1 glycine--tRNA ligase subunit beta [Richelia sp.]